MEAKGLCEALAKIKPAPSALVVRGISDLADEKKAALEADRGALGGGLGVSVNRQGYARNINGTGRATVPPSRAPIQAP